MTSVSEVVLVVRAVFDPLAEELALRGPELKMSNTRFRLFYLGELIGLEIAVEVSEFYIFALPFRVTADGGAPRGFIDFASSSPILYLHQVLDRLNLPYETERMQLRRLRGDCRNASRFATILANLVRRSWPKIVENGRILFPVS